MNLMRDRLDEMEDWEDIADQKIDFLYKNRFFYVNESSHIVLDLSY